MGVNLNLDAGRVEEQVVIDERLCLTKDGKRVVPDTDPAAHYLWAVPGQSVSKAAAERLGALKSKTAPAKPKASEEDDDQAGGDQEQQAEAPKRGRGRPPGSKNRPKPADKAAPAGEDKQG